MLTPQFKAQEPGSNDEILQFCQANYGVTFPIARKVSPSRSYSPLFSCSEQS